MLKITNQIEGAVVTFKLEGKLVGAWVNELKTCWEQAGEAAAIRVDLTEVSWVSAESKTLLAAMYCKGAELLVANLWMAAVITEIRAEHRIEKQGRYSTMKRTWHYAWIGCLLAVATTLTSNQAEVASR